MSKKLYITSEVLFIFTTFFFIYLFFNDKVFKYMILGTKIATLFFGILILTGFLVAIPLLVLFIMFKIGLYKEKINLLTSFNFISSFALLVFCIFGIMLQSNFEKTIKLYGTEEKLLEIVEERLLEKNSDNFKIEIVNGEVKEGNPIWSGLKNDDSFAQVIVNVKVYSKNEDGIKEIRQYDYMYDGRQLELKINCYSDGICSISGTKNGPIIY